MPAEKADSPACADARDGRLNRIRIDGLGLSALKSHQNGPIRTVTDARQGERAIQAHRDLARRIQQAVAVESSHELVRRAHRTHCVRARGADADLKDVEYAQRHVRFQSDLGER